MRLGANGSNILYLQPSGNVSIGSSLDTHKLYVGGSLGIANQTTTNTSLMSEYALSLTNPFSTNGNRVGICFGVSGNQMNLYSGGASIVHTRTDTNSVGSLAFNVKTSSGALDALVEAFRVNADASTTFNFPMTIAGNLTFSGTSPTITGLSSITPTTISGTLSTGTQGNIISLGTLSGLTIGGNLTFTGASRVISGLSSLTANTLTGTLSTAAQTAITSVGTLSSLTVSGISSLGSVQIAGTEIITSGRHIQNIGDITCSGTMNAFDGYQLNGATLVDSTQNMFAASVLADYAQLDKTAGTVYSSTLLTNQYNLSLSNLSNVSATFSGLAFHIDTVPLSGATPGACIISERNSTTAYDGSSISFCTKGTAGSANALTKRMTITKTGAINFGDDVSTDGDLLLIKSGGSPLFRFGTALSTKNCISMMWNYAGAAFDANRLSFDIYGSSNLLSLNANRRVCINGDAPTSQFHIVSTGDNMYSTNWERVTEYWGSLGVKAGVIIYKEAGGSNANGVSWGTYTNDPSNWFIGGTNCMQLNTSKRLNINRSSGPEATLHAGGMIWADELFHSKQNVDGKCVYRTNWSQAKYLGMGTDATVGAMRLGVCDANFNWVSYAPVRGGAYTNASDRRIKPDIIEIPYGLAEVLRMQPRKFAMRNDQSQHVGFIAQEMFEIIPECISGVESSDDELNDQGEPINPMGIDLASLVSVLCKAIQELKKELDELRSSTA
jgi:hypothetical protein